MSTSPISTDPVLVSKILDDQPDPKTVFKRLTFDEVKSNLESFLTPEGESEKEGSISSEPAVAFDGGNKSNYSLEGKDSTTKSEKFDSLFEDKKSDTSDDLPF
tara:strand:- start:491 stop:799 length:309 start_codon:yes stop_codon:yes gene_type:complete